MVARQLIGILRISLDGIRTNATLPSLAIICADVPAERTICPPFPGFNGMRPFRPHPGEQAAFRAAATLAGLRDELLSLTRPALFLFTEYACALVSPRVYRRLLTAGWQGGPVLNRVQPVRPAFTSRKRTGRAQRTLQRHGAESGTHYSRAQGGHPGARPPR